MVCSCARARVQMLGYIPCGNLVSHIFDIASHLIVVAVILGRELLIGVIPETSCLGISMSWDLVALALTLVGCGHMYFCAWVFAALVTIQRTNFCLILSLILGGGRVALVCPNMGQNMVPWSISRVADLPLNPKRRNTTSTIGRVVDRCGPPVLCSSSECAKTLGENWRSWFGPHSEFAHRTWCMFAVSRIAGQRQRAIERVTLIFFFACLVILYVVF